MVKKYCLEALHEKKKLKPCMRSPISCMRYSVYVHHEGVISTGRWFVDPPRQSIRQRYICWYNYGRLRIELNRGHVDVVRPLNDFNQVNYTYRNYARIKQRKYEQRLVDRLPKAPKISYFYLRGRKKGCNCVSDSTGTIELFVELLLQFTF